MNNWYKFLMMKTFLVDKCGRKLQLPRNLRSRNEKDPNRDSLVNLNFNENEGTMNAYEELHKKL
jgi:hypothetical protein